MFESLIFLIYLLVKHENRQKQSEADSNYKCHLNTVVFFFPNHPRTSFASKFLRIHLVLQQPV